jgi:hypothetical protein
MSALQLAGLFATVLALAGIAWAMGLGGPPALDRDRAMAEAEERLAGFAAAGAFLSEDGVAALVWGERGDFALVKAHGVDLAVRRLSRITPEPVEGGVRVESGERMFGAATLQLLPAERDRLLAMVEARSR